MGPHFWTTAVLKISMSHSDISFFHFSGTFLYPKGPFAPHPLQIAYEKICMPLYLTNLSIVQFYLRFLDFVPFAKYASVTVWHVTFDPIFWENGFWQGYQRLSHTRILLLVCEKWFWRKFKLKWMFDIRIPFKKVHFVTVWHFGSCLDFPILPPQIPSLVPISWFFQHLIHIWQRKKCRTFPYLPHPIVIRD